MGIYLNPKNKSFWQATRSEIYVDKTGLIAYTNKCINTEQRFICVSRPRRFGKSMALNMLAAYYSCGCDSRELFAGRKIEKDKTFTVAVVIHESCLPVVRLKRTKPMRNI